MPTSAAVAYNGRGISRKLARYRIDNTDGGGGRDRPFGRLLVRMQIKCVDRGFARYRCLRRSKFRRSGAVNGDRSSSRGISLRCLRMKDQDLDEDVNLARARLGQWRALNISCDTACRAQRFVVTSHLFSCRRTCRHTSVKMIVSLIRCCCFTVRFDRDTFHRCKELCTVVTFITMMLIDRA